MAKISYWSGKDWFKIFTDDKVGGFISKQSSYTLQKDSNSVPINIDDFIKDKDTLLVFENQEKILIKDKDYTIDKDSKNILKAYNSTFKEKTRLDFLVFENVNLAEDIVGIKEIKLDYIATVNDTINIPIKYPRYEYERDIINIYYKNSHLFENDDFTFGNDYKSIILKTFSLKKDEKIKISIYKKLRTNIRDLTEDTLSENIINNKHLTKDIKIGSLNLLITKNKSDIVSSINETIHLIEGSANQVRTDMETFKNSTNASLASMRSNINTDLNSMKATIDNELNNVKGTIAANAAKEEKDIVGVGNGILDYVQETDRTKMDKTGGTFTGNVTIASPYSLIHGNTTIIDGSGKIWRSVYNDLAEFFKKNDNDLEPGDIVIFEEDGVTKSKVKQQKNVVGVYSDTFGICLGGEDSKDINYNYKKYIPVGISGRIKVKVKGPIKVGDLICSSNIKGIGCKSVEYIPGTIVAKALENINDNSISRIWALISNI